MSAKFPEEIPRVTAQQEFDSVVGWLQQHGAGVDHGAFLKACDQAAIKSFQEASLRVPHILGQGYKTLDFAAALLRTYIPSDAMHAGLPGNFQYDFNWEQTRKAPA